MIAMDGGLCATPLRCSPSSHFCTAQHALQLHDPNMDKWASSITAQSRSSGDSLNCVVITALRVADCLSGQAAIFLIINVSRNWSVTHVEILMLYLPLGAGGGTLMAFGGAVQVSQVLVHK